VKHEEYIKHDAVGLAGLVQSKQVSPRELVEAALARIDAVNPRINAVIHRLDEQARRAADGPLPEGPFRGVPFLVKDLDGTLAGAPCQMGSRSLRDHVAPRDSELFARYRRAGLVFVGKTNTPEFGILAITEPELHGPTRNPWDRARVPGGSSGGSAAAVAAGVVPVAHGGDGGGSIRIPASCCGLFGLKPTRGRMPLGPDLSEGWHGFVVPHVLSRSVRDSAAFLDATQGPDVGAPYVAPPPEGPFLAEVGRPPGVLRVGFTLRSILGKKTDPACARATEEALALLSELGHEVREISLPIDPEELSLAYLSVVAAGTAAAVNETEGLTGRRPSPELFEPPTWLLWQVGNALSAVELEEARNKIGRAARAVGQLFESIDVLVTPTLAHPPARVGELGLKPHERVGLAALRRAAPRPVLRAVLRDLAERSLEKTPNTMLFNMTGQPAMSLPLGWSGGLPIGVQVVGRFGAEATLLRLAAQVEGARPWFDRLPVLLRGAGGGRSGLAAAASGGGLGEGLGWCRSEAPQPAVDGGGGLRGRDFTADLGDRELDDGGLVGLEEGADAEVEGGDAVGEHAAVLVVAQAVIGDRGRGPRKGVDEAPELGRAPAGLAQGGDVEEREEAVARVGAGREHQGDHHGLRVREGRARRRRGDGRWRRRDHRER
jgi:amidase